MFVRGGAIIPMGPEMNYVGEKPAFPLFAIYPDEAGKAATTLYEDDGTSPAYKQGVFRRTSVSVSPTGKGFQINLSAPEGSFDPGARQITFYLKTSLSIRQVLLDDKAFAKDGVYGSGWRQSGERVLVTIPDDGKAHKVEIK